MMVLRACLNTYAFRELDFDKIAAIEEGFHECFQHEKDDVDIWLCCNEGDAVRQIQEKNVCVSVCVCVCMCEYVCVCIKIGCTYTGEVKIQEVCVDEEGGPLSLSLSLSLSFSLYKCSY